MSTALLLAIDSGNTAIKWGLHDGERWITLGRVLQNERQVLQQVWHTLPLPESVIIANVAGKQAADDLTELLKQWPVQPHWVIANNQQCGVINNYTEPTQLGSDRWAALIAAWYRLHAPCLVVDVGTAMTVDALSASGYFLGGIILPGPYLVQQSLIKHTDKLAQSQSVMGCYQDFPVNTNDALYSGTIQALCGALQRMHHLLAFHSEQEKVPAAIEIIMTGGGAALLDQFVTAPHRIVEHLVLEGLVIIAQTSRLESNQK